MSVHAGSVYIDTYFQTLPKDIWIALNAVGIVSEDRDLNNVLTDLQRRFPSQDFAITYLPSGDVQ